MSLFKDGPAAGVNIGLQRSPVFLRVVQNGKGEWDALDMISDKPADDESVHVYRKISDGGKLKITHC